VNARRRSTTIRPVCAWAVLSLALLTFATSRSASAFDVVLSAQGEYIDGYLVNGKAFPPRVIVNDPEPHPADSLTVPPYIGGRHLNGQVCLFPQQVTQPLRRIEDGGSQSSTSTSASRVIRSPFRRGYVVADDEYREACLDPKPPQARCSVTNPASPFFVGKDIDGWAVFDPSGRWTRKHIQVQGEPAVDQNNDPQGAKDPQGCAFLPDGRLLATDVGSEITGVNDGALMVFFPNGPNGGYESYCFLDKSLADPGMLALDDAGNIYVPEPQALRVTKFSPPYPSSPADCANPERLVTTPPKKSTWLTSGAGGLTVPVSITRVRGSDHFYVAGVLAPAIINEYDANGAFVRNIVPADVPKNPLGMDTGRDGTLYYAELNLDPITSNPRCGSVSMVQFDAAGNPLPPVTLGMNLQFPDGITVIDSSELRIPFTRLKPSPDIPASECGGE
jgi:hypothetical protein